MLQAQCPAVVAHRDRDDVGPPVGVLLPVLLQVAPTQGGDPLLLSPRHGLFRLHISVAHRTDFDEHQAGAILGDQIDLAVARAHVAIQNAIAGLAKVLSREFFSPPA